MNAGTRGDRRKAIIQRLKDEEDERERLEALAELEGEDGDANISTESGR